MTNQTGSKKRFPTYGWPAGSKTAQRPPSPSHSAPLHTWRSCAVGEPVHLLLLKVFKSFGLVCSPCCGTASPRPWSELRCRRQWSEAQTFLSPGSALAEPGKIWMLRDCRTWQNKNVKKFNIDEKVQCSTWPRSLSSSINADQLNRWIILREKGPLQQSKYANYIRSQ